MRRKHVKRLPDPEKDLPDDNVESDALSNFFRGLLEALPDHQNLWEVEAADKAAEDVFRPMQHLFDTNPKEAARVYPEYKSKKKRAGLRKSLSIYIQPFVHKLLPRIYARCMSDALMETLLTVRAITANETLRKVMGTGSHDARALTIGTARREIVEMAKERLSEYLDARGGGGGYRAIDDPDPNASFHAEVDRLRPLWSELCRQFKSGNFDEWGDLAAIARVKKLPDAERASVAGILTLLDSGGLGWRASQPLALALRHAVLNLDDEELRGLDVRSLERRYYAAERPRDRDKGKRPG
jgi:hypothetical protein